MSLSDTLNLSIFPIDRFNKKTPARGIKNAFVVKLQRQKKDNRLKTLRWTLYCASSNHLGLIFHFIFKRVDFG
jgi:hypothetical protein